MARRGAFTGLVYTIHAYALETHWLWETIYIHIALTHSGVLIIESIFSQKFAYFALYGARLMTDYAWFCKIRLRPTILTCIVISFRFWL